MNVRYCMPQQRPHTMFTSQLSVFRAPLYLQFIWWFLLRSLLYLSVSWAWWDWPLTQLASHSPSVLWHCWLAHLTRKIVPEMTCNVLSGTLNPSIHRVKKTGPFSFEHNLCKYCPILIILSLLQTEIICPQTCNWISHFTYRLLLHYLKMQLHTLLHRNC